MTDIRCYPTEVANRNVPADVFLVAQVSMMSGEIVTTYYIDTVGDVYSVGDWSTDRPRHVLISDILKLTGDTVQMLDDRFMSWLKEHAGGMKAAEHTALDRWLEAHTFVNAHEEIP